MKWVKYALFAIAPIVLAFGVWSSMGKKSSFVPNSFTFVDVETGEIVVLSKKDVRFIPAKNTRDGKPTLFPVEKDEQGNYKVAGHYGAAIAAMAESGTIKVDPKTLAITN